MKAETRALKTQLRLPWSDTERLVLNLEMDNEW